MCNQELLRLFCGIILLLSVSNLIAEERGVVASTDTVFCQSSDDGRQHCPADTTTGVILQKSTGLASCLLGKTWGYDDKGVWVKDGCSGDFLVGQSGHEGEAETVDQSLASEQDSQSVWDDTYGTYAPGKGAVLFKGPGGEVSISAYALLRYLNQMPADQTFTDHLGNEHPVNARHDIYSHRVMVFLNGWVGDPKMIYNIAWWTVNTTDQDALFANLGYRFDKKFNLFAGINGNPGSRSMFGSHPYWLGNDRVMADEFFRPFFASGLWANGEVAPGLWYSVMAGNSSSTLGVTASQLDRELTTGGSIWWMPTTHEFGPRGGYGDWEMHQQVATRFGISTTDSPEERYTEIGTDPGNTALKLADSLNIFSTGSLAPGVTVTNADYRILAVDAGVKYKGFFFQTEYYRRWLNGFKADGVLPVEEIIDHGFYIQTAFYPVPKKIELYVATSQIYGDKDAGFSDSSEYLVGMNYFPWNTRNHRLNVQLIDVNHSPVSSTFGYYTGGQDGTTLSIAMSIFF